MKLLTAFVFGSTLALAPAAASATDLYNQTNLAAGTTPVDLLFTAGSTNTTLSFGGYDVPSYSSITDIFLHLPGDTTNILGGPFVYTAASCGALAGQSGPGTYGTNNLTFGGTCAGSYDMFSQAFASTIGTSYELSFNVNSSGRNANGFLVQASDVLTDTAAVPEPTTWLMMLLGFGAMGFAMRRSRQVARLAAA